MKKSSIRRNIDIADEIWRDVGIKAAKQGKTKREIVEKALKQFISSQEGKKERG